MTYVPFAPSAPAWRHGAAAGRIVTACMLLMMLLWEGLVLQRHPSPAHAVVSVAGLLVSLCLLPWGSLRVRAALAVIVSWTGTGALLWLDDEVVAWGLTETVALLVLLASALRRLPLRATIVLGSGISAAALAEPVRDADSGSYVDLAYCVVVAAVAALGLYLRAWDVERERYVAAARDAERLTLAGELHDFLTHNVSAITVLARASGALALDNPHVAASLQRIEAAGGEAMASARRMVRVLGQDGPAERQPLAGLDEIEELVGAYAIPGTPDRRASLHVDAEFSAGLAPDLAATVFRIVGEALANVTKHSPDATTVDVALWCRGGRLHVSVVNDGGDGSHAGRPRRRRPEDSGGLGLIGLSERTGAIGGSLTAGHLPEAGWEVLAVLPCDVPRR